MRDSPELRGALLADMKGSWGKHFVGRVITYLYTESRKKGLPASEMRQNATLAQRERSFW
jgi:hypothetical protein